MRKGLSRCPVCGSPLVVVKYRCPSCGTGIEGEFPGNEFSALDEESLEFLRVFVRSRGNLSEVAKTLGVSHPTARARLDALLRKLGYIQGPSVGEILDMLEKGEISPQEAAKRIRGL